MRSLAIGIFVLMVVAVGAITLFPLVSVYIYHDCVKLQKKWHSQVTEYWKDPEKIQDMRDWLVTYLATHEIPQSKYRDEDIVRCSKTEFPACMLQLEEYEGGFFWPIRFFVVNRKAKAVILTWGQTDREFGIIIGLDGEETEETKELVRKWREYVKIGENAWAWRRSDYD